MKSEEVVEMSIEKSLAMSLLLTASFVVLPITSIFTAYRAADGAIFLSILGLGMTVLSIGIMEWFDVGHPNAALASYILIAGFVVFLLFNLLFLWIYKDD
jgi:hypothetical protein